MSFDYEMPAIPGINWQEAHRYLTTKEDLLRVLSEMVASAVKQTELLAGYRDRVMQDPSDENHDLFKVQAHAMKASVRSIGSDLFDEAYALEIAGRDRDTQSIINNTDHFTERYLKLTDSLRPITGDTDKKGSFDEEQFLKGIKDIREAMDAFDVGTLQESEEKIMSMEVPDIVKEEMSVLEEAVRDLESEKVIECCNRIESIMRDGK